VETDWVSGRGTRAADAASQWRDAPRAAKEAECGNEKAAPGLARAAGETPALRSERMSSLVRECPRRREGIPGLLAVLKRLDGITTAYE